MEYLIIVLLNLIIYFRTINFGLVIDDVVHKRLSLRHKITGSWTPYRIYQKLYGAGMFISDKLDHLTTLVLHTIASLLIYYAFGQTYVSFIASLIYSVHPANNQTAIWLNGRRYLINIIIVLLMWGFRPWGFLLFPATITFQLNAFLSPLLLLSTKYAPLILLIPVPIAYLLLNKRYYKMSFFQTFSERFTDRLKQSEYAKIKPQKLIIMTKTYGYYFFLLLFPYRIAHYQPFLQLYAVTKKGTKEAYSYNLEFWKGVLAVSITSALYYFFPEVRLYIFWYVLFISIWCNLITSTQVCADRYTSLAGIGYYLTMAYFLVSYPILLGIVMGFYIAQNLKVQKMYGGIDNFFFYHLLESPKAVLGAGFYVKHCMECGLQHQALTYVLRALHYNPNDYRLLINYAKLLNLFGYVKERDNALAKCESLIDEIVYQSKEETLEQINNLKG